MLTMTNNNDIASKFQVTIRIWPNISFNYLYLAELPIRYSINNNIDDNDDNDGDVNDNLSTDCE